MNNKTTTLLLVSIIAVAIFFRFYELGSIPPGLFYDVAMNGNNAVESLETGKFKVFYSENYGREGLFINLQALSILFFGKTILALKIPAAIIGVLTIIGTYYLAKELFSKQIGLISSFLLAVSFWHVNFSRIGFRAIMAPLFLVFTLFFLWRGLKQKRLIDFIISGVFLGLGFHTYITFRVVPLIVLLIMLFYWYFTKKSADEKKQEEYKKQFKKTLLGFLLIVIFSFIVLSPLLYYFYSHPEDLLSRSTQISIFTSKHPILEFTKNCVSTLAMFNIVGDYNWRHNISRSPLLPSLVGILFIIGFVIIWTKAWRKKVYPNDIRLSAIAILLTFFIGLLPTVLAIDTPHALRSLMVSPIVFTITGVGVWWVFEKISELYYSQIKSPLQRTYLPSIIILFIFLLSVGITEYNRYFNIWGKSPYTQYSFSKDDLDLAMTINSLPKETKKYIVVCSFGAAIANGIPMPGQTIAYLTDTYTNQKQKEKNIYYLLPDEYNNGLYDKNSIIMPFVDKGWGENRYNFNLCQQS